MPHKGSEGESGFRKRHLPQQGHQLPRGALQAEGKAISKRRSKAVSKREEALKANVYFCPESVSKISKCKCPVRPRECPRLHEAVRGGRPVQSEGEI